jgi:hypothetical protein
MLIYANRHHYMFDQYELLRSYFRNIFIIMVISIADTINTYIGFSIIFHKEKFLGSKSIGSNLLGSYYLGSQSIGSHSLGSYYRGSQL